MFEAIFVLPLAFIGALILALFRYTQQLVRYIGAGVFFIYTFGVMSPFIILARFKEFREDPKKFLIGALKKYQMLVDTLLL
nr:MAG TPA: hypothetical protein [Caudoviricetes sp.]